MSFKQWEADYENWESQSLFTLASVIKKANFIFSTEDTVRHWLSTPNNFLEFQVPMALIKRGEGDQVLDVLDSIGEGVPI